jgi:phosphate starvation-inducible PhoH-like protein
MSMEESKELFGHHDKNIAILSQVFDVELVLRAENIIIGSDDETLCGQILSTLESLLSILRSGQSVDERDVIYLTKLIKSKKQLRNGELTATSLGRTFAGKLIFPKTLGQKQFVDAMHKYDIVFAIGPAGTGKTYLAVVYAVQLLKQGEIRKIILTRPAVEAGENLGFLPGDLKEKVDPYLRPLYDSLHDLLGVELVQKYIEKGVIEIAPLAYMRGRTLEDAFIILDEAQNTTNVQMKMFLTRMGFHSKMVVNGDVTQVDLKYGNSGLIVAHSILKEIKELCFVELTSLDVVRHPLVQRIIDRYKECE